MKRIGHIVQALALAMIIFTVSSPSTNAATIHQNTKPTGECFAGGTPAAVTVANHLRHHGTTYRGTTTVTLATGNSIHYRVDYTVVSPHTWTGKMVVASTEISHTFYYVDGSTFFAENGSYASATGTEYDLCAVLGAYPTTS